jgi:hypothetical protein
MEIARANKTNATRGKKLGSTKIEQKKPLIQRLAS